MGGRVVEKNREGKGVGGGNSEKKNKAVEGAQGSLS